MIATRSTTHHSTSSVRSSSGIATERLISRAHEIVRETVERSLLFDTAREESVPSFDYDELVLGRIIGRGGFGVVHELVGVNLRGKGNRASRHTSRVFTGRNIEVSSEVSSLDESDDRETRSKNRVVRSSCITDINSREYVARRVWSNKGGKYVVKLLNTTLNGGKDVKQQILKGSIDLFLETKYLAVFDHPHIIALRGTCRQPGTTSTMVSHEVLTRQQFIIIDRLPEKLSQRLTAWMHSHRATKGITGFLTRGKKRAAKLLSERLLVAHDVAEAMDYIHSKRVVYRDLKPDNIGFDNDGIVKLFDFGVARELREDESCGDGLYNMTGQTGAIRYMAPEVALNRPYNLKADIYSYSMLLWYILALEPPMGMYSPKMFMERVFKNQKCRPALFVTWPEELRNLLQAAWSSRISDRPTFQSILMTLRKLIIRVDPTIGNVIGSMDDASSHVDALTDATVESSKGL